jgi:hypothetical protein
MCTYFYTNDTNLYSKFFDKYRGKRKTLRDNFVKFALHKNEFNFSR